MGTTDAKRTIRKFNSALKQISLEFKNNFHDTTCRMGGKSHKVWFDTRFKLEEFRAFKEEARRSKKACSNC